ncbi:uncharacterized protein LOC111063080 isoform X2 [Nilaparvata lugens]|uniref:uncharacterized protein LOC111063080 isoform X2 n=1 Tax=Nilaparvata lugens TaxID=108931 RepID=UPI00193D5A00|nr:uncharacterized protein LOC111063080 isoform X2 [Nilaparvata lugens]
MLLKGGDSPAAQWCNVECTAQIRARSGGRIPFCEANTTRRRPTVTLIAKLATVIIDASNFKAGECITAPNSSDKMAADQQFCLRWNNHQSTLIQVFDTLLASEQLVDCTLAAEGQYLKAHKVVLSACSPYLELLLAQHYEKHPIVILKDVKFQELKSMMDYMYRGEVNISQDQLSTFLKAAESLQIKGLTDSGEDSRDVGSTKRVDGAAQGARKAAAATGAAAASSGSNRASPAVGGTGLTIEPRPASPHHRDASLSPTPRKRRRARRPSQGDAPDSHNDTSNSCDLPPASALAPPEQHIETEHINNRLQNSNNMELIKEKVEPTPELMIEPKTEYMDENNEDSVEDLTLDDDDDLDMNRSGMDMGRPGPSHGDSNQGFATSWHMQGDRSGTDEVFMAAQEAVGAAHRDSQAYPYYLKSRKGCNMLVYNGYVYRKNSKYMNKTYWLCSSRGDCHGRAVSVDEPLQVVHCSGHNHLPNEQEMIQHNAASAYLNTHLCRAQTAHFSPENYVIASLLTNSEISIQRTENRYLYNNSQSRSENRYMSHQPSQIRVKSAQNLMSNFMNMNEIMRMSSSMNRSENLMSAQSSMRRSENIMSSQSSMTRNENLISSQSSFNRNENLLSSQSSLNRNENPVSNSQSSINKNENLISSSQSSMEISENQLISNPEISTVRETENPHNQQAVDTHPVTIKQDIIMESAEKCNDSS